MSQELLAMIGEREVEIRKLRTENESIRQEYHGFQAFVADAIRNGRPLTIVEQEGQPSQPMIATVTPGAVVQQTAEDAPEASEPPDMVRVPCGCDEWGHSLGCAGDKLVKRSEIPQVTVEMAALA